jgi:hypothetical protein
MSGWQGLKERRGFGRRREWGWGGLIGMIFIWIVDYRLYNSAFGKTLHYPCSMTDFYCM